MTTSLIPRSIRGRLLAAALLFIGLALVFASLSIGEVLDRFVRRGLNERLDSQIALLARAVRADGSADEAMLAEIGPFTRHDRGWGWRIVTPSQVLTSRDVVPIEHLRRRGRGRDHRERDEYSDLGNYPSSAESSDLYARTLRKQTSGGIVTITVAAPRSFADEQRMAAVVPVLACVAALGVLLLLATLLQLHLGLRPLARLKAALGEVRAGRISRIPTHQPLELRDMVTELNGLLDENEAALARARGHVANLAHSLKTPLATLSLKLAENGRGDSDELSALAAQIDHAIRHHLGRARAASPGAPGQRHVNLAVAVGELATALDRIHAERGIVVDMAIAPGLAVKCDPQDLDEMLGNLLDNAWQWAAARIAIDAEAAGQVIVIHIDDDGPGLSPDAITRALIPGQRLDEAGDGHGFGLPITRELAELHGGTLHLGASPRGGLRATLTLPA